MTQARVIQLPVQPAPRTMSVAQAETIVTALRRAYPSSRRAMDQGTAKLYVSFLVELDYELASAAVRDLIRERDSDFCPTVAEIRKACRERAAVARRQAEMREVHDLLDEPSDEERRHMAEQMRAYIAERWGDWSRREIPERLA